MMAGGRPSKYKPEYCKQLIEYFSKPLFEVADGKQVARLFPTFTRFATMVGVNIETLRRWERKNQEFAVAYQQAKASQESILVEGAMSGE